MSFQAADGIQRNLTDGIRAPFRPNCVIQNFDNRNSRFVISHISQEART